MSLFSYLSCLKWSGPLSVWCPQQLDSNVLPVVPRLDSIDQRFSPFQDCRSCRYPMHRFGHLRLRLRCSRFHNWLQRFWARTSPSQLCEDAISSHYHESRIVQRPCYSWVFAFHLLCILNCLEALAHLMSSLVVEYQGGHHFQGPRSKLLHPLHQVAFLKWHCDYHHN